MYFHKTVHDKPYEWECDNEAHSHIIKSVDEASEEELVTIGQGARMYCLQCGCEWNETL